MQPRPIWNGEWLRSEDTSVYLLHQKHVQLCNFYLFWHSSARMHQWAAPFYCSALQFIADWGILTSKSKVCDCSTFIEEAWTRPGKYHPLPATLEPYILIELNWENDYSADGNYLETSESHFRMGHSTKMVLFTHLGCLWCHWFWLCHTARCFGCKCSKWHCQAWHFYQAVPEFLPELLDDL